MGYTIFQMIQWSGWYNVPNDTIRLYIWLYSWRYNMIQVGRIYKIAIDQNDDAVLDI